jgi:hydrogenase nickel incorporation protein HypB
MLTHHCPRVGEGIDLRRPDWVYLSVTLKLLRPNRRIETLSQFRTGGGLMIGSCQCSDPKTVHARETLLASNSIRARHNREQFAKRGVWVLNLMGSPGSGKTALLEVVAQTLAGQRALAAMTGEVENERDAERLRAAGLPTVAISACSACHLDAQMVQKASHQLPPERLDYLLIENVGNLACQATYDLGQSASIIALELEEVELALEYPAIFRGAALVLLTKTDLHPHLGVRINAMRAAIARLMPRPMVISTSAITNHGIDQMAEWLEAHRFVDSWRAQTARHASA